MPPQLIKHTIDHRHTHRLTGALALADHFDGDGFDRISRTHGASVAPNRR